MVDFICMGFLLLQGAEARFTKRNIRLGPLDCEAIALTARPRRSDCQRVKT